MCQYSFFMILCTHFVPFFNSQCMWELISMFLPISHQIVMNFSTTNTITSQQKHNLISIEKYNFNLIQICVTFGNNPDYELSLKHTAKYIYFNIRE